MAASIPDHWQASDTYESFMGRWSRPLAEEFVRWLGPEPDWHWLDVGAGTGAVTAAICKLARPESVIACEPSAAFLESARSRMLDPRVRFEAAGAEQLPLRLGGYDAVVSGLALNFFPDPAAAVARQLNAARPGGYVAACVWDYAEGMELLRWFWDAAKTVDAGFAELDEGKRFPVCSPPALESLFRSAGAQRVRLGAVRVPTVFTSFEDYWRPFLGGTGPAPSLVSAMSAQQRTRVSDELRRRLPFRAGGSIELSARAWTVSGERQR